MGWTRVFGGGKWIGRLPLRCSNYPFIWPSCVRWRWLPRKVLRAWRQHLQVFEIVSFVSGAKIGMMEYHAVTGNWPASNGEMGVGSLTSLIQEGGPPSAIIRGGGAMDITMSDRKNGLNGKALTIRAWQGSDSDTPVAWMCGHAKSSVSSPRRWTGPRSRTMSFPPPAGNAGRCGRRPPLPIRSRAPPGICCTLWSSPRRWRRRFRSCVPRPIPRQLACLDELQHLLQAAASDDGSPQSMRLSSFPSLAWLLRQSGPTAKSAPRYFANFEAMIIPGSFDRSGVERNQQLFGISRCGACHSHCHHQRVCNLRPAAVPGCCTRASGATCPHRRDSCSARDPRRPLSSC